MRRGVIVVVMVLVALLLGSYVLFTQRVVAELRREAQRTSEMFGEVLAAQDPDVDPASAILELANDIRESGVPMIVTDANGNPTATANLPFDESDPRAREWIRAARRTEHTGGRARTRHQPGHSLRPHATGARPADHPDGTGGISRTAAPGRRVRLAGAGAR